MTDTLHSFSAPLARGEIVRHGSDGLNMLVVRIVGDIAGCVVCEGDEWGTLRMREFPAAELRRVLTKGDDLPERLAELEHTFDLRWKADMRAIGRWRKAGPGRDMVLPDHADLVVWLLEQLEKVNADKKSLIGSVCGLLSVCEDMSALDDFRAAAAQENLNRITGTAVTAQSSQKKEAAHG